MPKVSERLWGDGMPSCPVSRKVCYPSRSQAKKFTKRLKREMNKDRTVYECNHCGKWHVGGERR
jgi:heterodisulfide reductase subunit C